MNLSDPDYLIDIARKKMQMNENAAYTSVLCTLCVCVTVIFFTGMHTPGCKDDKALCGEACQPRGMAAYDRDHNCICATSPPTSIQDAGIQ